MYSYNDSDGCRKQTIVTNNPRFDGSNDFSLIKQMILLVGCSKHKVKQILTDPLHGSEMIKYNIHINFDSTHVEVSAKYFK